MEKSSLASTFPHLLAPDSAIRKWTNPGLSVYIASITIQLSEDEDFELDRESRRLINRVARFLRELAAQHSIITKLYATSFTPTGIALRRNADFQEIGQIGKRIAFECDLMTSNAPLALKYRGAIDANE